MAHYMCAVNQKQKTASAPIISRVRDFLAHPAGDSISLELLLDGGVRMKFVLEPEKAEAMGFVVYQMAAKLSKKLAKIIKGGNAA